MGLINLCFVSEFVQSLRISYTVTLLQMVAQIAGEEVTVVDWAPSIQQMILSFSHLPFVDKLHDGIDLFWVDLIVVLFGRQVAFQITSMVVAAVQWTATPLVVRTRRHCAGAKQTGVLISYVVY